MFWIVSAILGIFGLMGTIGANIPQKDRATQIKEACERQFGVGTSQTADCQLAIITKTIRDQRNEKMGQALRDSGG